MLIYDRRRCRPASGPELRRRLTLPQRAKLIHLEHSGWTLLFVRGEPATAYVAHGDLGQAIVSCDGRLVMARTVRLRDDDAPCAATTRSAAVSTSTSSHAA